jgi:sugar/nucleoside kinase (ribokinase family)
MRTLLARAAVEVTHLRLARQATVFRNTYTPDGRTQSASAGDPIAMKDIPPAAFESSALLVGPVLGEVDPAVVATPRKGLLMVDGQGFVRHLAADGTVVHRLEPRDAPAIRRCDILKVDSQEAAVLTAGAAPAGALEVLCRSGPVPSIVTLGARGALIHDGRQGFHIVAPRVRTVDPTGAGDVFAAAFLMRYAVSRDPLEAGRYAVCAAALSTRGYGIAALPSREEIRNLEASVVTRPAE